MKTIKLIFTITAVAVATVAIAVDKPKLEVIPLSADRAIVSVKNENAARFEVSVKTEDGILVYYKQSEKPLTGYRKIFDFENMEHGKYVFNLKVNETQVSREFEIDFDGIGVGSSKMRFDPYFNYNHGIVKFSYLNFNEENLKFKIFRDDNLIFQRKLGNDFAISTGYDLNKLEEGEYRVQLSSLTNEYNYSIVK